MTLLPLLYALLAALTGFSAEAGPVRERQVAAASAVTGAVVAAARVSPRGARVHLAIVDLAASAWRGRAGLRPHSNVAGEVAEPLPLLERPARRRE